jgi:hypothetical protein
MSNLSKLTALCKCSVYISVNDNRSFYENIEENLLSISEHETIDAFLEEEGIDKDIYKKIIELNNLVQIQAYDKNPVGSFTVYHYDLDLAIEEMINIIENDQ